MTSVFRWQEEVQQETEIAFLLKTTQEKAKAVTEEIVKQHSYDCPCVVEIPVHGGHPAFLQWVAEETASTQQ
jgi:periplasmic divalent cation tolerance protein